MHPALRETSHRPWPLPRRPWIWRQSWLDLLFMHYPVDADVLRKRLPEGVRLQEFGGSAWIGVVPFRMQDVMARAVPSFPPFARFPELNVRTYVECDGKAGVWFLSLDAPLRTLVAGGRSLYGLPYYQAEMEQRPVDGWIHYSCRRFSDGATFHARYRGNGEVAFAGEGSFEQWVAERYCLFSEHPMRGLLRLEVHHAPWPLQAADVEVERNTILDSGLVPQGTSPFCHFSPGVHVVGWAAERVRR